MRLQVPITDTASSTSSKKYSAVIVRKSYMLLSYAKGEVFSRKVVRKVSNEAYRVLECKHVANSNLALECIE